jgi:K+ transporter
LSEESSMNEEGKKYLKRTLPGLIGAILLVYGGLSLATIYWSTEAYQTATQTNIYSAAIAAVIGIILVLFWLATGKRK